MKLYIALFTIFISLFSHLTSSESLRHLELFFNHETPYGSSFAKELFDIYENNENYLTGRFSWLNFGNSSTLLILPDRNSLDTDDRNSLHCLKSYNQTVQCSVKGSEKLLDRYYNGGLGGHLYIEKIFEKLGIDKKRGYRYAGFKATCQEVERRYRLPDVPKEGTGDFNCWISLEE